MSEKSDWEQGYDQAQRRFYEERKVLTARIAELETERDYWRKSYINLWRHINNLPQPPEVQE